MHILLTRPERQGHRTAALLRARGHRVTHAPLLRIETNTDCDIGKGPFAAVAFSSANAIDAMAQHPKIQSILNVPTFVVGERTAEAAREAGFANVISANGDVERLAEVLTAGVPSRGPVLYLAGEDRAGDLAGRLEAAGHRVRTVEIYCAVAAAVLPDDAVSALQSNSIDAVLHYSRRSAEAILGLAAAGSCVVNLLKCKHFCLSAQVAEPLREAGATQVFMAQRPDEASLLVLVGNI